MSSRIRTVRQRASRPLCRGPRLAVAAAVLLALALGVAIRASSPSAQAAYALAGQPARAFALSSLASAGAAAHPITLADERGHPVLLVFMYTLCAHCLSMARTALNLQSQVPGLRVLLVDSPAESRSVVAAYLARLPNGARATVLLDDVGAAAHAYHVNMYPTTVLIDGSGIIRNVWIGETSDAPIFAAVRQAARG